MRRIIPVLIVLVLATLVAWMALHDGEPPGVTATAGGDAAVETSPSPGTPPDEDTAAPPERRHVTPAPAAEDDDYPFAPEPGDEDDPAEEELPPMPTIRVVDAEGRPLEGVPVGIRGLGPSVFTDAAGEAPSPRPAGKLVEIAALGREVRVEAPVTVVTVTDAFPVEVRFVDLETMRPLEVTWGDDEAPVSRRIAGWAREDVLLRLPADIRPPQGWVDPSTHRMLTIGRTARRAGRFVAVLALPREVRVRITVLTADGSPAVDAYAEVSATGDWRLSGKRDARTTDENGKAELRNVPFRRGERVVVNVSLPAGPHFDDGAYDAEPVSVLMTDYRETVDVTVRLPEEATSPFEGPGSRGTIGIGGDPLPAVDGPLTASLRVRARLRDGAPAAEAQVYIDGPHGKRGTTDADGVAVFEGLPAGTYTAWIVEGGVVPTSADVEVAVGAAAAVEVHEGAGRTLDVEVVDARGRPLPGARVQALEPPGLPHWSYLHVEDGVQQMQLLTDAGGRARLVGLGDDAGQVYVTFGSRGEQVRVGRSPGPIRVQLPDAE